PMLCNIAFLSHLLSLMPPLPPTSTLFPYNDALPIFHAKPGSRLTLEFRNLDNVWNGVSGSIARELKAVVISEDGRAWKSVPLERDRKSTRLNSSHLGISYAVFCLKKKKITIEYK